MIPPSPFVPSTPPMYPALLCLKFMASFFNHFIYYSINYIIIQIYSLLNLYNVTDKYMISGLATWC